MPLDQLHLRCWQANFIAELLSEFYHLPSDQRTVTYALEAGGVELEWAVGAFLVELNTRKSAWKGWEEEGRGPKSIDQWSINGLLVATGEPAFLYVLTYAELLLLVCCVQLRSKQCLHLLVSWSWLWRWPAGVISGSWHRRR
jgi:hypothetical protein